MGRRHEQQKMAGKKLFPVPKKKKRPRRQRHLAADARNKRHVQRHAADYTKCFAHTKFQNKKCHFSTVREIQRGNPRRWKWIDGRWMENLIDFVGKMRAQKKGPVGDDVHERRHWCTWTSLVSQKVRGTLAWASNGRATGSKKIRWRQLNEKKKRKNPWKQNNWRYIDRVESTKKKHLDVN